MSQCSTISKDFPIQPLAVTVADACRLSGLGTTTIYELIKEQRLRTVTVGRRRLVIFASLELLLVPESTTTA